LTYLKNSINILYQNFILFCEYILSKVSTTVDKNIWVDKLEKLIYMNKFSQSDKIDKINKLNLTASSVCEIIKIRNAEHITEIKKIIKQISMSNIIEDLIYYMMNLRTITVDELNCFFKTKVIKVENENASIINNVLNLKLKQNEITTPYIKEESKKEYSLVLDLDETLVSFELVRL